MAVITRGRVKFHIHHSSHSHFVYNCILFTVLFKKTRTLKFKSRLRSCVFRYRQSSLRSQATNFDTHKHTKRSEIHQSQITNHQTFWTRWSKLLLSKRSAKMIDRSKKRKRQFWLLNFRIRVILKSAVVINNRKVLRCCVPYLYKLLETLLQYTKHS